MRNFKAIGGNLGLSIIGTVLGAATGAAAGTVLLGPGGLLTGAIYGAKGGATLAVAGVTVAGATKDLVKPENFLGGELSHLPCFYRVVEPSPTYSLSSILFDPLSPCIPYMFSYSLSSYPSPILSPRPSIVPFNLSSSPFPPPPIISLPHSLPPSLDLNCSLPPPTFSLLFSFSLFLPFTLSSISSLPLHYSASPSLFFYPYRITISLCSHLNLFVPPSSFLSFLITESLSNFFLPLVFPSSCSFHLPSFPPSSPLQIQVAVAAAALLRLRFV